MGIIFRWMIRAGMGVFGKQKALNAEEWLNPVKMSNGKNIAFFPE